MGDVMKIKHLIWGFAAAALLAGTPVPASAAPLGAAAAQSNDALEATIEKDLKNNSMLAPRHIDVDVAGGVVTLKGTVRTAEEKERAGSIAKVRGVTSVNNRLEVNPNVDKSTIDAAADKTKAGVNKGVDATATAAKKTTDAVEKGAVKTEEGVAKAAEKTGEALSKTGAAISDATVTTNVKAKFSNEKILQNTAIDVDTKDHVVTLKGTVGSSDAKARAGAVAASIDGVARVNNELIVR
jgi:hyperosmotically inducible periplasmic protein